MSKLVIHIECESIAEFHATLRDLLSGVETVAAQTGVVEPLPEHEAERLREHVESVREEKQEAPPAAEPAKPRRARKPKVVKDEKEEAPKQTTAPTPPEPAKEDLAALFGDAPAADGAKEEASDAVPEVVTRDMLREAGNKFMAKRSLEATSKLLEKYGITKLSELPESQYREMYMEFITGAAD